MSFSTYDNPILITYVKCARDFNRCISNGVTESASTQENEEKARQSSTLVSQTHHQKEYPRSRYIDAKFPMCEYYSQLSQKKDNKMMRVIFLDIRNNLVLPFIIFSLLLNRQLQALKAQCKFHLCRHEASTH